ncbi:ABC transporter ATP-binding protein [Spiroplasma sp. DGKH1]|uniref:ABC transporter ATP-binding protein n=1 Tax=Spiroplasma sp. DGKH1 TaxID=3050074 RepID=UPI0034C5E77E
MRKQNITKVTNAPVIVSSKQPVIIVDNFVRKFKKNTIGPFNFTVTKGKLHTILGASGSGKTVLIKSLIGGLKGYKGSITIEGKKAGKIAAKQKIGYVPEYITFPENISAWSFLKNFGKANGIHGKYLNYRLEYLMKSLGIWDSRNKDVNSFSSGMKKRVMIIQGIIHDPEILILDEPEAGLDVENREKIIKYLKALTLRGKTVFFSSHLLNEIKDYIDEFTMVMNGQQYYTGNFKQFNLSNTYFIECKRPDLISRFLTINRAANWYDKNTNRLFFIIPSPLSLFYITNFALKYKIPVTKISTAEFTFNFLNQKITHNQK